MKKILISKLNMEKTYSGASRRVHEETRYLCSLGYEVHIISEGLNVPDIKASGGIPHKSRRYFWQKKENRRSQFSKETLKLADKLKADLLVGHGDFQYPDIHFIHNCVHLASEKVHGVELSTQDEMYLTHTPIIKNHQYKHIVANSFLMKNELMDRFNIPSDDISVLYPAINENQFKRLPDHSRDEIRAKLGVAKEEFLVGLVTSGNFKKRGVDRFFQAIDLLPKDIAEKTYFVFVGKDKLPEDYQKLLAASPYKHRIRHLPISDQVEEYFNALDIFVLPARIEEFGRVVAEAMACGAPVITTKWVGASEIIKGNAADFIYDGESVEELSELMTRLLADPDLRKKVSLENQESAKVVYESALAEQFKALFSRFIG